MDIYDQLNDRFASFCRDFLKDMENDGSQAQNFFTLVVYENVKGGLDYQHQAYLNYSIYKAIKDLIIKQLLYDERYVIDFEVLVREYRKKVKKCCFT